MNQRYPEPAGHSGLGSLIPALFDFEALPGRYPLTLREPRALFERSREVLMLASGRVVEGLALDSQDASAVQRAACFFVRRPAAVIWSGVREMGDTGKKANGDRRRPSDRTQAPRPGK